METSSASERGAASRSGDDRDLVGVSIRLDGKWKYQRIREGTSRRRLFRARGFFVQGSVALSSSPLTIG